VLAGVDRQVWRVVAVVVLGAVMSVLDTTIVNVALETLSRDLHSSLVDMQWVVTAYLLALGAVIPLTTWLCRRFGAKQVYLASIVLFTLGSALCGLATSTGELIAFRVLQGVGGGLILPVGQTILVRASGPRNLARVMSAFSVPVLLSPVLGPTIGGLLVDYVGWRWIFYVNVPIGLIAVVAAVRNLPVDRVEEAGRIDLIGLLLVASGLVSLTYGLAEVGGSADTLVHVVLPLASGAALVALFVWRSLRVRQPLLDVRLYANGVFSAASLTMFSVGAALFGSLILLPLYFQTARNEDALTAGLLMAPRGLGAVAASIMAGWLIDRAGSGPTAVVGATISLLASIPFVALGASTSYALICGAMTVQGFGMGLTFPPVSTAAFRALRDEQVGDAAPQLNIIQRVGASIGTAILTVVLQQHLVRAGSAVSAQADAFGATFRWVFAIGVAGLLSALTLAVAERRRAGHLPADPDDVDVTAAPIAEKG
jgi:EmrB/QacA subfamily drug resistance transporter